MTLSHSFELRDIASLRPWPGNSRKHSSGQVKKIADSIREFGFTKPVLTRDDTIIAGHGAVEGARSLGMEQVPCIRLDHLSAEQARAYVIADNRIAEDSEWDEDALAAELQMLQDLDFDLSATGMDFEEIDRLLQGVQDTESFAEDKDRSTTGERVPVLSFGKYKVEMTPDELADLTAKVEGHVDTYGSYHGFVGRLLMAASQQSAAV
jgi:hypothetical protein